MNKPFDGEKRKSGILGFVRNDFRRKLFSVIIALLVTLLVNDILDQEKTADISNVPVKFELPQDIRFQSSVLPEFTATVTVRGKRSVVDRLTESDFEIVKKVTGKSLHDGNVKIVASDVTLKKHIFFGAVPRVRAVSPGSYHLELDREITKEDIPININYDRKELPQGYVLERIDTPEDQRFVTVRGPSRIVSGLKKIETERVSLDKATQDFTMTVGLIRPDGNVTLSFDRVPFTFRISGQVGKNILGVPVQLLLDQKSGDGLIYTVEPAAVTVNLEEPAAEVGKTEKSHLHPYVLTAGLKEGRTQCDVRCWCEKNDVRITSIVPDKVTVLVTKPAPAKPQPTPQLQPQKPTPQPQKPSPQPQQPGNAGAKK